MKKYDNYKDSGIEWLGEIPNHWKVTKLKFIGDAIGGLTYAPNNVVDNENEGVLVLRSSNIQNGKLSLKDNVFVNLEISDKLTLKKGDILICSRNGSQHLIGKNICINERTEGSTFGAFMMIFRSKYYGFLNQYFNSPIFTSQSGLFLTATINQLTSGTLNNFYIAIPKSIEEQTAIANYLDHKTTQINTLIVKKEQFISLLKEESTAVINQAVTKGLDPKVKMKDSGIEWLGEVPEHWEVKRIGHISKVIRGASPRPAGDPLLFNGDFLPWITVKEVTNASGKFITSTESFLTELGAIQTRILEPETLILSNSGATLGVPRITLIRGGINDGSVAFLNLNIERDYLYYFFTTHTNIYRDEASGYGQPNLNTEIVKSTKIPVPPIVEQLEIIKFIEKELSIFEELISKSQQEIELLKEYKTALISEVVTGKIDVRDEVLN
ncbi:MAG: restriction endonuclease subunit S [Flavobacterium sp.]|nr:restriction endonuclease subunit S [Flavobacterium sp.]